jgi:hypothetical protein
MTNEGGFVRPRPEEMQQHFVGMCSSPILKSSLFAIRMVEFNTKSTDAFNGANATLKGIPWGGVSSSSLSLSYFLMHTNPGGPQPNGWGDCPKLETRCRRFGSPGLIPLNRESNTQCLPRSSEALLMPEASYGRRARIPRFRSVFDVHFDAEGTEDSRLSSILGKHTLSILDQ